jgi:peptide/nickel transport system substrate-binding protein
MLKKYCLYVFTSIFLCACSSNKQENTEKMGRGGVYYGGTFRFMTTEIVNNLFPLEITTTYAQRVSGQIFQGLLKLDPEGTNVAPCLAESYTLSKDALTFTFKVRKGVHFQDDACFSEGKGREITAKDFKYSLEYACSNKSNNKFSWLVVDKIKGAKAYLENTAKEVAGIKVINDYTLSIELNTPFAGFEQIISHPALSVFPKEAVEKYGANIGQHPVGTGPFLLSKMTEANVILTKNNTYWEKDEFGNQLPYMDSINVAFNKDKSAEILAFRHKDIDLVLDIPVNEIQNILGTLIEAQEGKNVKHRVESMNGLSVEYYGFAHQNSVFSDKKVRLAFNYAINREGLIESALSGDVLPIDHGFIPAMDNYPGEKVKGYTFNLDLAKQFMAEAGYPDGKGFPEVDLYINSSKGSTSYNMAEAVVTSLSNNLNIVVRLKNVSYDERVEAINSGKAIFWRAGWIADYPDPENFLSMFQNTGIESNEVINPFKYDNPQFDSLFDDAKREINLEKRMQLYAKCDQTIIDDAVVMPVFFSDVLVMINLRIRNFNINSMERLDFTKVYIKNI